MIRLFKKWDIDIVFNTPEHIVYPDSWVKHIPFAFFLIQNLQPRLFVELGVYSGNSFFAFCQAVKNTKSKTKCVAVDTWEGDIHIGNYTDIIFHNFQNYLNQKYSDFASVLQMTFNEANIQFENGSIDLLHIDGTHTYEAVKKDFEMWLPKMSSHGIVLFHDTAEYGADYGVWQFWNEVSKEFPSYHFNYGHGLGVLVVGQKGNNRLVEFLKKEIKIEKILELAGEKILLEYQIKTNSEFLKPYHNSQLFYKYNHTSYNETDSINIHLTDLKSNLEFDISHSRNITGLRFDPINDYAKIRIDNIVLVDVFNNEYLVEIVSSNAVIVDEHIFFFDQTDPIIYLEWNNIQEVQLIKLKIEIEYLVVGEKLFNELYSRLKDSISDN